MYPKLKYLYFLPVFAACLASSCSSDTPDNVEVKKGSEMSFAVSNLTRASETTSFNKFVLFGDMKFPVDNNTDPSTIFNKTEVEYKNNIWSYEGRQYWFPKHEHSFVAVAPASVLETENNLQYLNSQLSFTYIIPTTDGMPSENSNVADILVATHRRLYNENDKNSTTTFHFSHIMSKINLAPQFDDNMMSDKDYLEFRKLELSGIKAKATFTILPASRQSNSQTDDRVIEITDHETARDLAIEFTDPVKVANDSKSVNLFKDNDAIIMLPQDFASDSDAKIVLSYTISSDPTIKQVSLPLVNKNWESGKSYTYRFTINRTGAHFDTTTITDWDTLNVGDFDAH
ncbi:MAG: fimbrillin family protein [Muribaculaceae bacterium]|nr:fimbrillin family protein [Muribaculaceae bacterium]